MLSELLMDILYTINNKNVFYYAFFYHKNPISTLCFVSCKDMFALKRSVRGKPLCSVTFPLYILYSPLFHFPVQFSSIITRQAFYQGLTWSTNLTGFSFRHDPCLCFGDLLLLILNKRLPGSSSLQKVIKSKQAWVTCVQVLLPRFFLHL